MLKSASADNDVLAGRQGEFLFKKGPDSSAVTEAQQRLCCPVAGAGCDSFVARLCSLS